MPVKRLPSNPNLAHLRYEARDLMREHAARLSQAAQRLREFHPRFGRSTDAEIFGVDLRLSDAQLTVARERGFASWARLKHHVETPTLSGQLQLRHHERIEDLLFRRAVDLIDGGDADGLRVLVAQHPQLVHQRVLFEGGNYFRSPTLLEFIAENPVRHGTMPANVLEVARVILDAGPSSASRDETLMLVATGSVPREWEVQTELIDLLCAYGARPDSALGSAAVLGEHQAARVLLRHGATLTLPVAAALGEGTAFDRLLMDASPEDRHLALAVAAQFGHLDLVRSLLDAGEDPNRYNPPGGHAHATPLHQAAAAGYAEIVRLLVERGARLDLKDVLWQGTPADWAGHEGKTGVEVFLRERAKDSTPS